MARLARVVVPGLAHHVTQRGNGRRRTFFSDADYALYRDLLARHSYDARVEVWAWCLMPNHVHLLLAPADSDGLRRALSRVHRAYAGIVHAREKQTGHFWQGRFGAVALDEDHLVNAFRYIALNPVRARLARRAEDWPWASTRAYAEGRDDGLTAKAPMLSRFPNIGELFDSPAIHDRDAFDRLRRAESIGRPLGDAAFLARIGALTGMQVAAAKRGPKRKAGDSETPAAHRN